MDHSREDQAGLFAAGDDFDGKAQGGFGPRQEVPGVARHAEGVGRDGADAVGMKAAQAVAEALEHGDGAVDRVVAELFLGVQAGREPDGFLETIDLIDLGRTVLLNDASDGEAEAVGPEVHRGQKLIHAAREILAVRWPDYRDPM
ncbi:hypothetical protein D9M68_650470 [compost metagenome]